MLNSFCIQGIHNYVEGKCKWCREEDLDYEASTRVTEIGLVCVYCGNETEFPCCGEAHHELGYETETGEILLESELTESHSILE